MTNWINILPPGFREIFLSSVSLSEGTLFPPGHKPILSRMASVPEDQNTVRKFSQFFTPPDVSIYSAAMAIKNNETLDFFDPCVGHGSLLSAAALVLFFTKGVSGVDLAKKLHGSEIDLDTRDFAINNLTEIICLLSKSDSQKNEIKRILKSKIVCHDFLNFKKDLSHFLVLVNPPYKELKGDSSGNSWIKIVDKILLTPPVATTMIVPVSISCATRTSGLRDKMFSLYSEIQAFHHETRPRPLFPKVEQRISIVTLRKLKDSTIDSKTGFYLTTGFLRHKSGERLSIWEAEYTNIPFELCKNIFPKVSPDQKNLYIDYITGRGRTNLQTVSIALKETGVTEVWVRTTGRYKFLAQLEKPSTITTKWKLLMVPSFAAEDFVNSFLNGDLMSWFSIFGDGRDISVRSLKHEYSFVLKDKKETCLEVSCGT